MDSTFIRPFSRKFPIEIISEIVQQMRREELCVFSLTNRIYNDEANRVLWKTARIAFDSEPCTLVPAAKAIRRDCFRARHIRTLVITPKRILDGVKSSGEGWRPLSQMQTIFVPDEVPLWTWKLVAAVIRGIPHLEHLEIVDRPSLWTGMVKWRTPILDRLLELSVASPLAHLKSFTTSIPLQSKMTLFCARCPQLERIVLHKTYPIDESPNEELPEIPSNAFQRLRHVTGPIDFVSLTPPGCPITEIQTNMGLSRAKELHDVLLSSSTGVQSLHISSIFSSSHPIAPALLRLAPLPIASLHTHYLLPSHNQPDSAAGQNNSDLWGSEMARALTQFSSLETFRCDIILKARAQVSEIKKDLVSTGERFRFWGKSSNTLTKLHFTFKYGQDIEELRFGRKIGGEWHPEHP